MRTTLISVFFFMLLLQACTKSDLKESNSEEGNGWLVPIEQLVVHEDRHDRIASIDQPQFAKPNEVSLSLNEEVLLYQTGNQRRIYPVSTIWAHEIVNDQNGDQVFTVSFCPLTGSGLAWGRRFDGEETTFGVSGSLYNNNLIPYDRTTGSYFSQMKQNRIKGSLGTEALESEVLLHTIYSTALTAYPDALVLVDSSGNHECDSICNTKRSRYNSIGFTLDNYFGVVHRDEAMLFDYDLFADSINLVKSSLKGNAFVVVGSRELGLLNAFSWDPSIDIQPLQNQLPEIMADSKGNVYDIMGFVTKGPDQGQRLEAPLSYSAKKYAWEIFFENNTIYTD